VGRFLDTAYNYTSWKSKFKWKRLPWSLL